MLILFKSVLELHLVLTELFTDFKIHVQTLTELASSLPPIQDSHPFFFNTVVREYKTRTLNMCSAPAPNKPYSLCGHKAP